MSGQTLQLRVQRAETVADGIKHFVFAPTDGGTLSSYAPGSHIAVLCGNQRWNAYSLTGDFLEPTSYEITVRVAEDGSGGSRWLHRELTEGALVQVRTPRSAFAPADAARHHVLVAGGIGVTPIVSHARACALLGRSFEVVYGYRAGANAHAVELRELSGDRLCEYLDVESLIAGVESAIDRAPFGSHVYVCGPSAMIERVREIASAAGWPSGRIHSELFALEELDAGDEFSVRVAGHDAKVTVPSGVSLLEALENARIATPSLCRSGVCGECRISVTSGRPLHRDAYLSEAEREANDCMMPCVSRAIDPELELAI